MEVFGSGGVWFCLREKQLLVDFKDLSPSSGWESSLRGSGWFLINFSNDINVLFGKSFPDIHMAFFYTFFTLFYAFKIFSEFIEQAKTKFNILSGKNIVRV